MKLAKNRLEDLLSFLAQDKKVFVPAQIDGVGKFIAYQKNCAMDFSLQNTMLPPKDILFPQTEKMYCFQLQKEQIVELKECLDEQQAVIFGIRPCDMQSIICLDDVFLSKNYCDNFYQRKREGLLTVCLGCQQAGEYCFCDSMGLNPLNHPCADIQLNDLGADYLVQAQTDKGQDAVALWQDFLREGEGKITAVECSLKVDMSDVPQKLAAMFDDPIWDRISRKCLGCGTCTYLCPTCYCFDIDGEVKGNEGSKFRCWDSCMFSDYSRMAGGHNPRPSKKERVRNRFLHKLQFFQERYGKNLCVGCGRCVEKCPVNLDITLFIEGLKEVPADV
ncbi:MAG: 4Fe-4S dicluster domain-containing protein [Clostridiales bacterium]